MKRIKNTIVSYLTLIIFLSIIYYLLSIVIGQNQSSINTIRMDLSDIGDLIVYTSGKIQNGSAVRYAMDGNFSVLIESSNLSPEQKVLLYNYTSLLKTDPRFKMLLGNEDGVVTEQEIENFENLIKEGSKISSSQMYFFSEYLFTITIDNREPFDMKIMNIDFGGAQGPVNSTKSITTELYVIYNFFMRDLNEHVLIITRRVEFQNYESLILFKFVTMKQWHIKDFRGLKNVEVVNDYWGLESSSINGEVDLTSPLIGISIKKASPTFLYWITAIVIILILMSVVLYIYNIKKRQKKRQRSE